jgi:hypothetical protein
MRKCVLCCLVLDARADCCVLVCGARMGVCVVVGCSSFVVWGRCFLSLVVLSMTANRSKVGGLFVQAGFDSVLVMELLRCQGVRWRRL